MITKVGRVTTLLAAILMTLGMFAMPAAAQDTTQEGLVNVNLGDVTVQVPIGIAANICDVTVAVLVNMIDESGDVDCSAEAESVAWNRGQQGGDTDQSGLVNVAVGDVTVQVPIAVAANICGVTVAVLVNELDDSGDVDCTAAAQGTAVDWNPGNSGGKGKANAPGQNR